MTRSIPSLLVLFILPAAFIPLQDSCCGQPQREAITWDHVYGGKRISLSDSAPRNVKWISDTEYLKSGSPTLIVDANTEKTRQLFEKNVIATALSALDEVSSEQSDALLKKSPKFRDVGQRLLVFEDRQRLIRVGLDGDRTAITAALPSMTELLTLSPAGNAVAFISENELWVADFESGDVRQLTHGASDLVRNGKADWVYFEEVYHRNWKAFRWSPDGLKIAFQSFDDSQVSAFNVVDHSKVQQSVEIQRFPKAGETNPTVRLGIIHLSSDSITWVDTSDYDSDDLIIAHFNWLPDSKSLYWYAQNRIQSLLDIHVADAGNGSSRRILRDQTPAWVDNPGDLKFLSDGSFLFLSDRSGWRHCYRATMAGEVTAVTHGEWEVKDVKAVSADESFLIVTASRDSPIEDNAYRVWLNQPDRKMERLTPDEGHHIVSVSTGGSLLIDKHSTIHRRSSVSLRNCDGTHIRDIHRAKPLPLEKFAFGELSLRDLPMADGSTTRGIVCLPPDFDSSKKYPVWLMSYGGPRYPSVRNTWRSRLREHMLANLGIVVIQFDPRTASGYSAKSAWLAYKRLGVEETRDVVAICDWLVEQPWADTSRIGMSGHSYGGYFTAYAMTHCDRLSAGIAGAPVTDWSNYDTIYTERFMSTPQDNPDGYRAASAVAEARKLHGKLLLIHGLKDDNVHPANSFQLANALQKHGKLFEIMTYPESRHSIGGTHYNKLIYNFIVTTMGLDQVRRN